MKYLLIVGLALLAVYRRTCLASILAQIPAAAMAIMSVALILMASHVVQAVYRQIGACTDPAVVAAVAAVAELAELAHPTTEAIVATPAYPASALDVDPPHIY